MRTRTRLATGAGLSIGAALAAPAGAYAEDFTVTNLNDDGGGSLREAIDDANADSDADRILFASELSGQVTLTGGELSITRPVEIIGPGARELAVSAGDDSRVFSISTAVGAPVTISGLTVTGGSVTGLDAGGGIASTSADLTLSNLAIIGNAAARGAGVWSFGDLTLENSTVSGNTATGDGGGVYEVAYDVTAENSTVSGNSAGDDGGGMYALDAPRVELISSTVAANSAGDTGGGIDTDGSTNVVTLRGSIAANNSPDDLHDGGAAAFQAAFSLVGDRGNTGVAAGGGNLLGVDPNLGALKDNGGPTNTHALGKGSSAKNAGPADAPATDQRGVPRKGKADIGAYELAKCGGAIVDVVGTTGRDRLRGDGTKNGILGLGGKDRLVGVQNRDGLCGGGGRDTLAGGNGRDKLRGGGGRDKLKGGKATDKLIGGPGNDKCVGGGGPGADKLKSC